MKRLLSSLIILICLSTAFPSSSRADTYEAKYNTAQWLPVVLYDGTDGITLKTGVVHTGVTFWYKEGMAGTWTQLALAATSCTATSGNLCEDSTTNAPGYYRVYVPATVVDTKGPLFYILKGTGYKTFWGKANVKTYLADEESDTLAAVEADVTGINGDAMRGTDSAALATNLATAQADLDNPAQYMADVTNLDAAVSSRMAEASINTTAGAVDTVTLVGTTTVNTDMRGTDGAASASALATAQADLDNQAQYKADVTNLDVAVSSRSTLTASDVWSEAVPGAYGSGTAGYNLDVQVSSVSGGGVLTPQQVRDAMKLAPTGGVPSVGSVDEHLDTIEADTADIQTNYATSAAQTIAQADLDTLTGTDGATLATAQANYAPAKVGDAMALTAAERDTLADTVSLNTVTCNVSASTSGTSFTVAGCTDEDDNAITLAADMWNGYLMRAYNNNLPSQCNVVGQAILVNDFTSGGLVTVSVDMTNAGFSVAPSAANCGVIVP